MTKTTATITIIISCYLQAFAQKPVALNYHHALVQESAKAEKAAVGYRIDTIEFRDEFFEDFSDYHYKKYPRNDHWLDRDAFINSSYADSMISLGVATLDAYDENGLPYYNFNRRVVPSDTLTSQPFAFRVPIDANQGMYFSFFYQAGGKGDVPEGDSAATHTDTLLLDFYSPIDSVWVNAAKILDDAYPHNFIQKTIVVADSLLSDGFQFRFRNYSSMATGQLQGTDPGTFGNTDMWHIDYIQMRQETSAAAMTDLKDMAITEPLQSFLTEYTSVPWSHYTLAQSAIESRYMPLSYGTYFSAEQNTFEVTRRYASIDRMRGDTLNQTPELGYLNDPVDFIQWLDLFSTRLAHSDSDYGMVEVVSYIRRDEEQRPVNDTVKRTEIYSDHYAYDDGTAEMGMSLGGEPEAIDRIAIRFRAFRKAPEMDTLRAVLIHFAKSIDSITADYQFHLSIRKNNPDGTPSNEILYYSEEPISPDYSVGVNEFTRIELEHPVVLSDTFFVCLEQITGFLNIGYDKNYNNNNKVYYYTQSSWGQDFQTPGSYLIRPSFGRTSLLSGINKNEEDDFQISLYPNPAQHELNLTLPDGWEGYLHIQVYNTMGQQVSNSFTDARAIAIDHLMAGVYFLVFQSADRQYRYTSKFIKE